MAKLPSDDDFETRINAAMDRCADGDDAAFGDVYQLMGPKVLSFLMRQGAPPDLARDLLQEVAIRLYRARGNFQRGASAMAWAYSIARNAYIDHRRSAHVRRVVHAHDESSTIPEGTDDVSPDQHVEAAHKGEHLHAAFQQLPDKHREAFELHHQRDVSVADGAQQLGISENAFKIRVHRAKEALKRALQAFEDDK